MFESHSNARAFLLGAFALLPGMAPAAPVICRVTPAGVNSNDGATWATPKDLQSALSLAGGCIEVWVAAGVYRPTSSADQTISFNVLANRSVYGGFAGTETLRSQRDPTSNVTVLSGDIDNNDANHATTGIDQTAADIVGNNSHVVVVMDGTTGGIGNGTVLDGFTITGGSQVTTVTGTGAGLYCNGFGNTCSPTLANLVFSGNKAVFGGGVYSDGRNGGVSSPQFNHVVFSGNTATNSGGAMFNDGSGGTSSPTLTDVTFDSNIASGGAQGGAMFNQAWVGVSSPTLTNVTFNNNQAPGGSGGAMYNAGDGIACSPSLHQVTFSENYAGGDGGALYDSDANSSLVDVIFNGNSAAYFGGALYISLTYSLSASLFKVTFTGNSALSGGAIYLGTDGSGSDSNPTLINVTFSGNTAQTGAAIYNDGYISSASPFLNNVTFSDNVASASGNAIYNNGENNGTASPTLRNVILWDGAGAEVVGVNGAGTTAIAYSVVQGGCPAGSSCTNLLSASPLLGRLQYNGGFTPTLMPAAGGSAIDTGDDATCAATDQRGVSRPQGAHCDIGAVERQAVEDVIFNNGFDLL
jgi:predicted outer membrane repeat protein